MTEISSKQKRIVEYIRNFWENHGYPPTVRDIAKGCSVSSTSVVDYNLKSLEKLGYIRRHSGVSRGIELFNRVSHNTVSVPVLGVIAAGEPIPVPEADTWDETSSAETIALTNDITKGRKGIYALRVKGQSMIDALINDGDIVLLQNTDAVENGDTVAVWLKEEKETTLKKVYSEGDRVRLQPANSQMKPFYSKPENVEIQGKVIAVIRQTAR
ncbi:MAG: transcriptional repressor LexA [Dehalococcoidales bacterium]|nr:transcriptional repressor LexA [Dehalococcoidales bacterium]